MLRIAVLSFAALAGSAGMAQDAAPSVDLGAHVAVIGGCHDCHSPNYNETGGQVDPAVALQGMPLGYSGPWGTTYPANLRLKASDKSEDEWVNYLSNLETRPPMPWYNVRAMTETEKRSLYQYIVSLGEPGDPVPEFVPPEGTPTTPYITMVPAAAEGQ